jgi:hypothetical protein
MRPYSLVVFDPLAQTFRRFGSAGLAYGQIARPQSVATDQAGHIRVRKLPGSGIPRNASLFSSYQALPAPSSRVRRKASA